MKISDIKIRTRLSFLAGFLLAAMLTVGATGWLALADTHQESIELTEKTKMLYGAADTAREAQVAFKIQIQEWKNLLLRGTDSNQFQKYRQAFIDQSAETQSLLGNLSASLSKAGVNLPLVGETLARHEQLSAKYLDTLARTVEQDHTINTYSASILDKAVQGMDRLPTQNIDDIVEHVTQLATRVAASGSESLEANFDKTTSILLIVMLVTCALGVLITVVLIQGITRPLSRAVAIAKTVASGDLNIQVKATSRDETGQLLNALQEMSNQLATVVGNVRLGTETIATASRQIAAGNLDLSSRTEEQASSLQETAASMEQLTSTVKQNADNAQQANQLATTASHIAAKGGEVISQVVRSMDSINVSSSKMSDIVGVIDGIAFQTNILALNAAVEAARVGEQGKGFAVVATEVRSLAQRSADAAKEIKELIETSANEVTQGAVLVDQAGATMAQIVQSVRRVSDIVNEISTASLEQTMGIEQVNVAVGQMDQVTQQNAALVEEASAASHSLQEQARALAQIVSVFKIGANTRTQSV